MPAKAILRSNESVIDGKGRVTIPKAIRERLRFKAGDKVRFFLDPNDRLFVMPVIPISALRGMLKTKRRVTIAEMNEAIAEAAVERFRRSTE